MKRALWSIPCAVVAWSVLGFGPWYVTSLRGTALSADLMPLAASAVDVVAIGGVIGGVAAGLLVRRLRIALPLVLGIGAGVWWFTQRSADPVMAGASRGLLVTLLVATGVGGVLGALGTRRSVLAAVALALPVASYALLPGRQLSRETSRETWVGDLNGVLVAIAFALLLYVACWRTGWRAVMWWPMVTAVYLAAFGLVTALTTVAPQFRPGGTPGRRRADAVADTAMDAFFASFKPFLLTYWPWLAAAGFLAVMMVALKIRALPPATPDLPDDDRSNDAYLSDDLDWIDREEPRRRLTRRRETVTEPS